MYKRQVKDIDALAYSFGNAIDIETTLKAFPSDKMIIGNIDPAGTVSQGTPEQIRKERLERMERCCKCPNFVIASGCDIPPIDAYKRQLRNCAVSYGKHEPFFPSHKK